ncbi:hypothetical protein Q7P37_010437 [Cladosporium fusiforme]
MLTNILSIASLFTAFPIALAETTSATSLPSPLIPSKTSDNITSEWQTKNSPEIRVVGSTNFSITAPPATDLWRPDATAKGDNFTAPFVYRAIKASHFTSMAVTVSADWKTRYDQGGLAIIFPNPDPKKWIKTGIEVEKGSPQFGTVGTYAFSDWSLSPVTPGNATSARFLMEREGSELWVYAVDENEGSDAGRYPLRELTWAFLEDRAEEDTEIWVGVYAAKPTYEEDDPTQGIEVFFEDLVIS